MDIFTNQTNSLDFRCLTFDLKMAAEESEFSRFPVELFVCNNFHLGISRCWLNLPHAFPTFLSTSEDCWLSFFLSVLRISWYTTSNKKSANLQRRVENVLPENVVVNCPMNPRWQRPIKIAPGHSPFLSLFFQENRFLPITSFNYPNPWTVLFTKIRSTSSRWSS